MSSLKYRFYRAIATSIMLLRQRSIAQAAPECIVITGSVGKTIMRRAVRQAYESQQLPVYSLDTDYVNEIGVVLTLFGLSSFHIWRPDHWWRLCFAPVQSDTIVVEIGADFKTDITWFLQYYRPSKVIFTYGTACPWTPCLPVVLAARAELARAVIDPSGVYVASYDEVHRTLLQEQGIPHVVLESEPGPYFFPQVVAAKLGGVTDIVPAPDRFRSYKTSYGIALVDTYKVTPLCLSHMLTAALATKASKRFLVLSEMRPAVSSLAVYDQYTAQLSQFDQIYFIGDETVSVYLKKNLPALVQATQNTMSELVYRLANDESEILLVVKTARFYRHHPALVTLANQQNVTTF